MNLNFNIEKLAPKFKESISLVAEHLGVSFYENGIILKLIQQGEGIEIIKIGNMVTIKIGKEQYFLRALGLVVEKMKLGHGDINIKESPSYDSLEIMLDCSRNAVLNFESYKEFMIHAALMGYTTVQLYIEDTYEIKGYPYFGYMRGRYSQDELKEMDGYASSLLIELIPAVQTLAHLGNTLKWQIFSDIVDFGDILLIGEEKTYKLIDDMFKTLSESFKSKKINIGMDEAHMVGLGKYLDKHGYQDRFGVMLLHLNKVMELARKYGYKPMMWSDMFFRLASGGEYYNPDSTVQKDIKDAIPEDISLVYWDYYAEEKETYDKMITAHKGMTENISFAGGAWKWTGFSPNNLFSHKVGRLAHKSCMENDIKQVIITAWGDNGAEASMFSILPTLQLWAELCYTNKGEESHLITRFNTCTNGDYEAFLKLDLPMLTPNNPAPGKCSVNPPKYILYQDILSGLFDLHIDKVSYPLHFKECSQTFDRIIKNQPSKWDYMFQTQKALCDVLEIKSIAGIELREAYKNGDRSKLKEYAQRILPDLIQKIEEFVIIYSQQWMSENKSFGLDVFDIRMGGLIQRIKRAKLVLEKYINTENSCIEELGEELLYYDGKEHEQNDIDISSPFWHSIATVSNISTI